MWLSVLLFKPRPQSFQRFLLEISSTVYPESFHLFCGHEAQPVVASSYYHRSFDWSEGSDQNQYGSRWYQYSQHGFLGSSVGLTSNLLTVWAPTDSLQTRSQPSWVWVWLAPAPVLTNYPKRVFSVITRPGTTLDRTQNGCFCCQLLYREEERWGFYNLLIYQLESGVRKWEEPRSSTERHQGNSS